MRREYHRRGPRRVSTTEKYLKTLNLRCDWRISDQGLAQLGAFRDLESLVLDLDDCSIAAAEYLPALVGPWLGPHLAKMPTRGQTWEWLGNITMLTRLVLRGVDLSDGTKIAPLGRLRNLQWLDIESRNGVSDHALAQISKLNNLTTLLLGGGKGKRD